jgi:cell division septum initiation protein DivIVA
MDIMTRSASNPCPKCAQLLRENEELRAHVRQLEEQLAEARKDSSTSAKPPSSDIVKPPKPAPDPNCTALWRMLGRSATSAAPARPLRPRSASAAAFLTRLPRRSVAPLMVAQRR